MLILPVETKGHRKDAIIVVLDNDNLSRMAEADPVEIDMRKTGKTLVNPIVLICHEEPTPEFMQIINGGDLNKIIAHLQRGWKFRPEKGDHDRGPESLKDSN